MISLIDKQKVRRLLETHAAMQSAKAAYEECRITLVDARAAWRHECEGLSPELCSMIIREGER